MVARPVPRRPTAGRHHREPGERRRAERRLRAAAARPGPGRRGARGNAERVDFESGHVDARLVQGERGAQLAERPRPELGERGGEGSGATPRAGRSLGARRQGELAAPLKRRGQERCEVLEARRRRADLGLDLRLAGQRVGRQRTRPGRARVGRDPAHPEPRLGLLQTQARAGQPQRQLDVAHRCAADLDLWSAHGARGLDRLAAAARIGGERGASGHPGDSERRPEPAQLGVDAAGERDRAVAAQHGPRPRPRVRATARRAASARGRRHRGAPLPGPLPGRARPGRRAAAHCRAPGRAHCSRDRRRSPSRSGCRPGRPAESAPRRVACPSQRSTIGPWLAHGSPRSRRPSGIRRTTPRPLSGRASGIDSSARLDTRPSTWSAAAEPSSRSNGWSARSSSSRLLVSAPPASSRPAALARSRRAGKDSSPSSA